MTDLGEKDSRRKAFELHLQNDHLAAIGHVAVRAAMLDKLVHLTAEQIRDNYSPFVRKQLERLSSRDNLNFIKDTLSADIPTSRNAIAEFTSEVHAAQTERNDIMHGIWRPTETPETKALVEITRHLPEVEKRRVTPASMHALATKLLDLAIELGDWKMYSNNIRYNNSIPPGAKPMWQRPLPRQSARDQK